MQLRLQPGYSSSRERPPAPAPASSLRPPRHVRTTIGLSLLSQAIQLLNHHHHSPQRRFPSPASKAAAASSSRSDRSSADRRACSAAQQPGRRSTAACSSVVSTVAVGIFFFAPCLRTTFSSARTPPFSIHRCVFVAGRGQRESQKRILQCMHRSQPYVPCHACPALLYFATSFSTTFDQISHKHRPSIDRSVVLGCAPHGGVVVLCLYLLAQLRYRYGQSVVVEGCCCCCWSSLCLPHPDQPTFLHYLSSWTHSGWQ